jgi:hypothetical protein
MLRCDMLNIRAPYRGSPVFPDSPKSLHNTRSNFRGSDDMTTSLVWTGVALWLALNAVVAFRMVATQPGVSRVKADRGLRRI